MTFPLLVDAASGNICAAIIFALFSVIFVAKKIKTDKYIGLLSTHVHLWNKKSKIANTETKRISSKLVNRKKCTPAKISTFTVALLSCTIEADVP